MSFYKVYSLSNELQYLSQYYWELLLDFKRDLRGITSKSQEIEVLRTNPLLGNSTGLQMPNRVAIEAESYSERVNPRLVLEIPISGKMKQQKPPKPVTFNRSVIEANSRCYRGVWATYNEIANPGEFLNSPCFDGDCYISFRSGCNLRTDLMNTPLKSVSLSFALDFMNYNKGTHRLRVRQMLGLPIIRFNKTSDFERSILSTRDLLCFLDIIRFCRSKHLRVPLGVFFSAGYTGLNWEAIASTIGPYVSLNFSTNGWAGRESFERVDNWLKARESFEKFGIEHRTSLRQTTKGPEPDNWAKIPFDPENPILKGKGKGIDRVRRIQFPYQTALNYYILDKAEERNIDLNQERGQICLHVLGATTLPLKIPSWLCCEHERPYCGLCRSGCNYSRILKAEKGKSLFFWRVG